MYTHNPYANSTTLATSCAALDASDASCSGVGSISCHAFNVAYGPAPPLEDPAIAPGQLAEKLEATLSQLPAAACTGTGRHFLLAALRLRQQEKIKHIYEELIPVVNALVLDPNGCHVVRTLVELISDEQLKGLARALESSCITKMATTSQHTRRVLQAMFERNNDTDMLQPVVEVLAAEGHNLGCTQQGCIALMRVMECANAEQNRLLFAQLLSHMVELTVDPYGNYVMQAIIDRIGCPSMLSNICTTLSGHWLHLCFDKFASNVLEKVVRKLGGDARQRMLHELVYSVGNLRELMQDRFGNFVLQTIIDSASDPADFEAIYEAVHHQLYCSPFYIKIDAKLRRKENELYGTCRGVVAPRRH